MKRNSKRGFTIVELIIVIAVIAVLAAVLIPTFSNLIGKAQEAKDTALVRNLNEALAMDTTTSKHTTMEQAVAAVRNNGIDISKIKATVPGNAILWDSVNDLFAYYKVDKDGNASGVYYIPEYSANKPEDGRLFAVVSDKDAAKSSKYGVYYIGADTDSITVNGVGFDAGSAEIGEVIYNGSSDGVTSDIRTNGGKLTVKAPKDTVNHYGTLLNATIEQVDKNSYHEYGTVEGTLYLYEGRVKVENGAYVSSLVVTAESLDNVKVESVGTLGAIAATKSTVASGLKNNANIAVGNADVIETEVADAANNVFAGGLGTEKSPYLIANENQFVHIGDYSDEMKYGKAFYFKLIGDVDLRNITSFNKYGIGEKLAVSAYFKGSLDGSNHKLISSDLLSSVFLNSTSTASLTDIDYYIVSTSVQLCPGQTDNTNVTFDNVDMHTVDENMVITLGNNSALYSSWVDLDRINDNKWSVNNNITIKNCDVYVDLTSEGYSAVFFGGSAYNGGTITIENSTYYGEFYGNKVNLVLGNTSGNNYSLIVKNVKNKGTLAATGGTPMIAGGDYDVNTSECKYGQFTNVDLGISRYLYDAKLELSLESNGLKITQAASTEVEFYLLTLVGGTRRVTDSSENSSYTFTIRLQKSDFENGICQTGFKDGKLATVEQYKKFIDSTATLDAKESVKLYGDENAVFWTIEKDGIMYYVFDFNDSEKYFATKADGVLTSAIVDVNSAWVSAYDKDGLPIAQRKIKL